MANLFDLEIVTPERIVFSAKVASVTCPGVQGSFQVLHNHAPFLSSLTVGQVTLVDESEARTVYAISGGISQVFHNSMRILADTAERAKDIDVQRAEEARVRAEQRLHTREQEIDYERARAALHRALNRLKVAKLA